MRRLYSDLHLCPNLRDQNQALSMVNRAFNLGYRLIAVTLPPNIAQEELAQTVRTLSNAGGDVASRVDLRPNTPNELLHGLRKLRRKFEVIAVTCNSKNVSRQAAKDRRVDLLDFSSLDFHKKFFDTAEAELASSSLASLEIDVKPLFTTEGPLRIRLLSNLRREATIAKAFHVPIVISSGVSNEQLLRRPMELATLASLFDLEKEVGLDAVSKNPLSIVRRNREKLGSRFVAPGIRVIRRGKDC